MLACAENGGIAQLTVVAEQTGVSRGSVRKWRMRFAEPGLKGLTDASGHLPKGSIPAGQ